MSAERERGPDRTAIWLVGSVVLGQALLTFLLLREVQRLDRTLADFRSETTAQLRATDGFIRFSTDGNWVPPEEALGPSLGAGEPRVRIVEFVDFECPACRYFAPRLRRLVDESGGAIALTVKHLPLPDLHPNAYVAALGGYCAHQAGRFWEYNERMYAEQGRLASAGDAFLVETAGKLGLREGDFRGCLQSPAARAAVDADGDLARRMGVRLTPTFFINGKRLDGPDWELLEAAVEAELRRQTSLARR